MTMSVSTITAIALQRYQILIKRRTHTKYVNKLPLIYAWSVGLLFGIPVFVYQTTEPVKDDIYGMVLYEVCVEKWPVPWGKSGFTAIIIVNQYFLPLIIIAFIHFRIIKLISMDRQYRKSPLAIKRENERNRKTTVLLVRASVAFFLSWLPFHIFHALIDYSNVFKTETANMYICFAVVHIIAMSSTLWNPLIYGFENENIKSEILDIYRSLFCSEVRVHSFITDVANWNILQKNRSPVEIPSEEMNARTIVSRLSTPSHKNCTAVTAV